MNKALHLFIVIQYVFQYHWQQFDEQYTEAVFREDRDLQCCGFLQGLCPDRDH